MISGLPKRIEFDRSGRRRVVENAAGCWLWRGARTAGHAGIRFQGKQQLVHRLVYELLVGDPGPLLHHVCETPLCINPAHMKPLAGRFEHSREHVATHCRRGHKMTPANTYMGHAAGRRPWRQCRICRAMSRRAYRERTGN